MTLTVRPARQAPGIRAAEPTGRPAGSLGIAAAACSLAAGAIHAGAAGVHDGGATSALFAAIAAAQIGSGAWLLAQRRKTARRAVLFVNTAAALAWLISRSVGLPVPDDLAGPQDVGLQDGLACALALGAVTLAGIDSVPRRTSTGVAGVVVAMATLAGVIGMVADHDHGGHDQSVPVTEAGIVSPRLPADEAMALLRLSARPILGDGHDHPHGSGGHGSGFDEPPPPVELSGEEARRFELEWAGAVEAAERLATVEAAEAAGYVKAAPPLPGVGSHWVKWSLVDRPFDPAAPSMLLFDTITAGRDPQLVGLSYWVASADEPEGFAGPNDEWHTHQGMCFVNGWLREEGIADRGDCRDTWIEGSDLWMLHAWPVAGVENPWGQFAPVNPGLCRRRAQTPDALSCDPVGR